MPTTRELLPQFRRHFTWGLVALWFTVALLGRACFTGAPWAALGMFGAGAWLAYHCRRLGDVLDAASDAY